uniref:Polyhomeotic homolog 2a (Drosophila) n=1 Tax=Poecilia latipinna TaxID=48699 RepID=A0A3B3UP44_9TELE
MTSGNGSTNSSQHNGDSKAAQQAIDKSQILTHLIEGFVIQEGAEPFPVSTWSSIGLLVNVSRTFSDIQLHSLDSNCVCCLCVLSELKAQQEPMLTCELCGKVDFAYIFKRSKRFCSTVCAKRYNVGCTKRMGLFPNRRTSLENLKRRTLNGNYKNSSLESKKKIAPSAGHTVHPAHGESSQCSDLSGYKRVPSPPLSTTPRVPAVQNLDLQPHPHSFVHSDPGQWNIQDVYGFISSLPGCLEIAEEFRSQEIDGQALLLLKEDHLMGTMNIKLGPALKIFAQISMLKDS